MIETGSRIFRHTRRIVSQLAEVVVSQDVFNDIKEHLIKLRLIPEISIHRGKLHSEVTNREVLTHAMFRMLGWSSRDGF